MGTSIRVTISNNGGLTRDFESISNAAEHLISSSNWGRVDFITGTHKELKTRICNTIYNKISSRRDLWEIGQSVYLPIWYLYLPFDYFIRSREHGFEPQMKVLGYID